MSFFLGIYFRVLQSILSNIQQRRYPASNRARRVLMKIFIISLGASIMGVLIALKKACANSTFHSCGPSNDQPHFYQILLDLIDSSDVKARFCLPRHTKSAPPSVRSMRDLSSDSVDGQREIFRTTSVGENWGSSFISTTHEHGTEALPENLSISEPTQRESVGTGIGTAHERGTEQLLENLSISESNQQNGVTVLKETFPHHCENHKDLSISPSVAITPDPQITTAASSSPESPPFDSNPETPPDISILMVPFSSPERRALGSTLAPPLDLEITTRASSPPESPPVQTIPATPPDLPIAIVSSSPQEFQALESTLASPGLKLPTAAHSHPVGQAVENNPTLPNCKIAILPFSPSEARGRMMSSSSKAQAMVYTPAKSVANDTEGSVTPPKSTMEEGGVEYKAQTKKEANRRKKEARKKREQGVKAKDQEEETVLAQAARERRAAQVAGAQPSAMPGAPADVIRPDVTLGQMTAAAALHRLASGSVLEPVAMPGAPPYVVRPDVTLGQIEAVGDAVGSGRAREETERDSLEELEAAMGMIMGRSQ